MKLKHVRLQVLVTLLATLCAALAVFAQQPPAPTGNHVVIITLDGFPGWALEDPYLPVPNLRRLAANGALAAGMRPVNPTVTWPNHTSLVTGVTPAKHGVLFNGTLVRDPGVPPRVEPWRDKKDMVHVPTLYDVVHDRGMTAAQVDWVAILNAPSIDWEFPERPERPETKPGIVREMVNGMAISQKDVDGFASQNIVWRDDVWTDAASHILRTHRPNLLLFHLLALGGAPGQARRSAPPGMLDGDSEPTAAASAAGSSAPQRRARRPPYHRAGQRGARRPRRRPHRRAAVRPRRAQRRARRRHVVPAVPGGAGEARPGLLGLQLPRAVRRHRALRRLRRAASRARSTTSWPSAGTSSPRSPPPASRSRSSSGARVSCAARWCSAWRTPARG